jgi:hypothetical protein
VRFLCRTLLLLVKTSSCYFVACERCAPNQPGGHLSHVASAQTSCSSPIIEKCAGSGRRFKSAFDDDWFYRRTQVMLVQQPTLRGCGTPQAAVRNCELCDRIGRMNAWILAAPAA